MTFFLFFYLFFILTDHQLDDTISVSKFSDVSSIHGDNRQRLESKDTIHTDATSMITIDGAISRTPSTKREKPSIDDTKNSRSDISMDKDSRMDSRDDSRKESQTQLDSTRLDSRTNLTSTDNDSKNGTPLLPKKSNSLSTDGDTTPTNSRRMTSTDGRSVSGISDLGDSVSQRGARRGNKSIDDTMSHDSSTLHAPASITSGNISQQVSSHMRTESEDHTTNSLHSMQTPKIEKSTAHDATSITASTTADSTSIKMSNASVKAEDAVSVSAASATGSTATAGTQGTSRTKKSQNSQMSKTTSANLSSVQATHDTASSHGLVPPSSDTASISTEQMLHSQSQGADATSMTRSDQTPTNQRNSQYLSHSETDGKRQLNSADTMSLTTLSRHPSMMSVTSSGQMSSVSQQKSRQPKKSHPFQFSGSETASVSSKQAPKISRVTNIYSSVYQGISDYISIFTAELNVLQTQLMHDDTPMQVKIDLEKQLNSTERILTKLQYQQNQATEIYEQYKIQEKYISKQKQLKSELQSTPVSSKLLKFFGGDKVTGKLEPPVTLKRQNSLRRSVMQKSANLVRTGSVRIKNPTLHRDIIKTKEGEKKSKEVNKILHIFHSIIKSA